MGPRPEVLEAMGDKIAARAKAKEIGVPTLSGTDDPITNRDDALRVKTIGFRLLSRQHLEAEVEECG